MGSKYPGYVVTNYLEDSTVSVSTEDAGYPKENLYNRNPAKPFRFTVTTGGNINIDMGEVKTWDTIAFIGHNFHPSVSIVVLADIAGTGSPVPVGGSPTYRLKDMYWRLDTPEQSRDIYIQITDANSENTEIGELIIGLMVELPVMFEIGHGEAMEEVKVRHQTQRGVRHTYDMYNLESRSYRFEPLTESERDDVFNMHDAVRGDGRPFLFVPILARPFLIYGRKNPDWNVRSIAPCRFSADITMVEESKGVRIEL